MTSEGEFELEKSWDALRQSNQEPRKPTLVQRSLWDVLNKVTNDLVEDVDDKTLALVTWGIQTFIKEWTDNLRNQDTAGLIEIVLERQNLSNSELQGFVQALPLTLLGKISKSGLGGGSGIHALMALEVARRNGQVAYVIRKIGERVRVDATNEQGAFQFYIDDDIDVDGETGDRGGPQPNDGTPPTGKATCPKS